MTNNELLKKQIIYRSVHRGSKEMDILLGDFVKKHITSFNNKDLKELEKILSVDDEILYRWYFNKMDNKKIPVNKVSNLLKNFKIA